MHFYDFYDYGAAIADDVRTHAYACAIREAVKPGSVVLDIGAGTGIFALLACRFGARKVYAVDPSDVIEIGREIAAANGFADRIEFIGQMSTRITLPEKADVIIASMQGVLPLFEQNLVSIIDARRRLLAPGGIMIPQKETLWAAVVEAPEAYADIAIPWNDNPYSLDMRAAMRLMTNTWHKRKARVKPEQLLLSPKCWATLDYTNLKEASVRGELTWTAPRSGTGHGFVVWFDSELLEGITFSNAPGEAELMYGKAFFPWPEPVVISEGDEITVQIRADLVGEDYIWGWETRVLNRGSAGNVKASFKQSTFLGGPFSSKRLLQRSSDYRPTLNEDGRIDQFILSQINAGTSVSDIASRVAARFPTRFQNSQQALTRIRQLSNRYCRQSGHEQPAAHVVSRSPLKNCERSRRLNDSAQIPLNPPFSKGDILFPSLQKRG